MNILLVTTNWPSQPDTGESAIVYNLIRYLCPRHDLSLIALTDKMQSEAPPLPGLRASRQILCPRGKSILGYMLHIASKYPYGIYAGTHRNVGELLRAQVSALAPELVQFCSIGLSLYEEFVPKNVPRVLLAADSLSLVMGRLSRIEPNPARRLHYILNQRKATCLEREVYPRFDEVVLVSEVDAEVIRKVSPGTRIQVIHNGVDTTFFKRSGEKRQQGPILGLVGNYGYVPNERAALRLMCDIFPRIKSIFPASRLFIIGSNPSEKMRVVASELSGATVTGFVKDIRPYLEQMDVFVAFIEAGGGIKNKVLEAMSMSLPVVGTKMAFEGIHGSPGKHFVLVDSVGGAVSAIERLIREQSSDQIGQQARALVEAGYSWAAKTREYEALWQAACGR